MKLLTNKWMPVVIKIKDTSNINIDYQKDSVELQLKKDAQKKEFLGKITQDILSTLSEDEFQLGDIFSYKNGFYGNITKEGFDKLLTDERVRKVYDDTNTGKVELPQSAPLIGANYSWDLVGYTGEGRTVCVIDTGVNYSHSAFGGCTEAEFLAGNCDKVSGGYDYYNNDNRCNMTFGAGYTGSESANFGSDSTINSSASIDGDYELRVSFSYDVDCSTVGAGNGYRENDGDFCEEYDYGENDGVKISLVG